jgi:hypothetical protein
MLLVRLLQKKQIENTVRTFSQSCQSSQEITISQITLFDIFWLRFSHENCGLGKFLRYLCPFDLLPLSYVLPFTAQGVEVGRETVIHELLTLFFKLFQFGLARTGLNLNHLLS